MTTILAIVIFAICLLGLGIGLLKDRCLSGSCGGQPPRVGGRDLGCSACRAHPRDETADAPAPRDEDAA